MKNKHLQLFRQKFNYSGTILSGSYSPALKHRLAKAIMLIDGLEKFGNPTIPYIAAWQPDSLAPGCRRLRQGTAGRRTRLSGLRTRGMDRVDQLAVRPYSSSDEQDVIALWVECGLVRPWNNPKRDIERKLLVNPEWFLVGVVRGHVIASCMAGYDGHRGWINYLAVSPSYRRRGVAAAMMAESDILTP